MIVVILKSRLFLKLFKIATIFCCKKLREHIKYIYIVFLFTEYEVKKNDYHKNVSLFRIMLDGIIVKV